MKLPSFFAQLRSASSRSALAWALYDSANSAFSVTIATTFFPIFFKEYWSTTNDSAQSTLWLGITISVASLIVACSAPLLGIIADQRGRRKHFLMWFMLLGASATAALFFVQQGQWVLAALCYAVGQIGFLGGNVFYDALLPEVSTDETVHIISGLGYAIGYIGGGLLFVVNVLMTLQPQLFGLASTGDAVRYSFLTVAVWWVLFALPILFFVKETRPAVIPDFSAVRATIMASFRESVAIICSNRALMLFLFAYWVYIDGVDTIITMSVDYLSGIGTPTGELITAILLVQFVAFPFALIFGHIGQKIGAKRAILGAISIYFLVTLFATQLDRVPFVIAGIALPKIYVFACAVAFVQGGIQSLSRSLFASMIDRERSAQLFGFFNVVGKTATIVGPVLLGVITRTTGSHRLGILSVAILFVIGGILLTRVGQGALQRQ
jgi:MFS transporter, UMF1 family